jgi:hypothetical protein
MPILLLLVPSSVYALEPENDPCNYHGLKVCNSSGECDDERFDCYTDDCVNGKTGITGQCDGDDDTVWCWDSQENNGECISTLLVTNLSSIGANNNISSFVTSFSSPVIACDYVDEKVYLDNTALSSGHFIRFAEGQLSEYNDSSLPNDLIPPAWAGGVPAECEKYLLFDFENNELYFFGDSFTKQGSSILNQVDSDELVKITEGLFTLNSTEPEFEASDCEDYCPGITFTEFKNQTYWTWWAPSDAILYPQPSNTSLDSKPEIFEKIDAVSNKMIEFCGCDK